MSSPANLTWFGTDEITFESFNPNPNALPDELGTFSPLAETDNTEGGCRHRPFRSATHGGAGLAKAEYPQPGEGIGTNWWQSTCPPSPAALAAKASDIISVAGLKYRIIGDARPFSENGRIVKVTFLSVRQTPIA